MLIALAVAGCSSSDPPPPGAAAVKLTVTRDFGATTLVQARAAPGQSGMNALRRNAKVGTAYGGGFVSSVDGVDGNSGNGYDWFYYINGTAADRGAARYTLGRGDHEWWDYRYWATYQDVPVVIGSWPEPFVNGYRDSHPQVATAGIGCVSQLGDALRAAGAHLTNGKTAFTVKVETFAQAAGTPLEGSQAPSWGLTVWLQSGAVMVYHGKSGATPDRAARAIIAIYRPGTSTGGSAALIVAGATPAAACAAAHTLATDPASVRSTYAVALDGSGHIVARGGQP